MLKDFIDKELKKFIDEYSPLGQVTPVSVEVDEWNYELLKKTEGFKLDIKLNDNLIKQKVRFIAKDKAIVKTISSIGENI